MLISRRIGEHRPTVILAVLVLVSLASMATGQRASFIRRGVTTIVSVTSYPFLKALDMGKGVVDYTTGLVFSYNAAIKEAETARQRLVEAMRHSAQRNELIMENSRLRRLLNFERSQPGFSLEPAKVLENFKGNIIIDRGSIHGIHEAMCAITDQGIVGVVTQVDVTTANVATLRTSDFKVGAMVARNRVRGRICGSSSELTRYCTMQYIDMKEDIRENDIVVTSPESSIFPPGCRIGRVAAVHDNGAVSKTADIEPAVDPFTLDELFILKQAVTPADELVGNNDRKEPVSVAPGTPDTRSIQDRFAP